MDIRLLCTDVHSESAKRLADVLTERLGYKVWRSDRVIPNRQHIRYGDQRDKLQQYKYFRKQGLNFPRFTESKEDAHGFIHDGNAVLCRLTLKGQEGHGIVIADWIAELVDAPVYVEYQEKTIEYRINLFNESIVNVREKRRKNGFEGGEPRIRNVENGYVYCIPRGKVPDEIIESAIAASYVTDSNIIGVDVAYNAKTGRHFLLEVNSAPAMEGVTVEDYATAIINKYEEVYE